MQSAGKQHSQEHLPTNSVAIFFTASLTVHGMFKRNAHESMLPFLLNVDACAK